MRVLDKVGFADPALFKRRIILRGKAHSFSERPCAFLSRVLLLVARDILRPHSTLEYSDAFLWFCGGCVWQRPNNTQENKKKTV